MAEDLKARIERLEAELKSLKQAQAQDRLCLVVFSGDWDKIFSSFVLATGAAARGTEVVMFFTFWGVSALRKPHSSKGKNIIERMFGWLMPSGIESLPLSRLNFAGIGPVLMNQQLRMKKVAEAKELRQLADDLGVTIKVCEMSINLLGFCRDDIVAYKHLEFCGAQDFLELAAESKLTLYI